ncbi:MAG TPA: FdhF/YdeP family oxidoreductase [Candidatus Marinimicrobia bacterium]|nr:FdhF/YdeP family oxidoreductase [Candidatus Neomarinimicrobiota bacterium]
MSKAVSGFGSIGYSLKVGKEVGFRKFFKSATSKNTCKTCAYGMGGQKGGMRNEAGNYIEVCKKSLQAQLTDIQPAIPEELLTLPLSDLRQKLPRELERLGRLNSPLLKTPEHNHFLTVTWDEALSRISERLKLLSPHRTFFYSSGRSSNEAAFLLQIFARVFGTNNVNNCSYYCHQASGVGLAKTIGSGTASVVLDDVKHTEMIWLIGANPSSNHPRFMKELLQCRRRGGKVIVINPLKEPGLVKFRVPSDWRAMILGDCEIASKYIQPNIGGDISLLKGVAKAVVERSWVNDEFVANYTDRFEEFQQELETVSWKEISDSSGVERKIIEELAEQYVKAEKVIFSWAMGITHHEFGVGNVQSIVNLALLRGMIGKPHAGLLPLRGHSNVQGLGSMGVTPALKSSVMEKLELELGVVMPEAPGMDTMQCMQSALNGNIDLAFLQGGNLYSANPDSRFAEQSLNNIPFKVFLTTTLNKTHVTATEGECIILPVAARDEEKQPTTQESMFNFVRMSDGGIVRLDNVRSESDIIAEIAHSVLGDHPVDWLRFKEHGHIREAIAKTIPGFEKIGAIDKTKEEFQIGGRTFHDPLFATENGRAKFSTVSIPDLKREEGEFTLSSVRSEGQFNTIIYEEEDVFRGTDDRWIVMMSGDDMTSIGVQENGHVHIKNQTGQMNEVKVKAFDIPKGNVAAFFPEANVLIPNLVDDQSKTPGFKSVAVRITKS